MTMKKKAIKSLIISAALIALLLTGLSGWRVLPPPERLQAAAAMPWLLLARSGAPLIFLLDQGDQGEGQAHEESGDAATDLELTQEEIERILNKNEEDLTDEEREKLEWYLENISWSLKGKGIGGFIEGIGNFFSGVWKGIKSVFIGIGDFFGSIFDWIKQRFSKVISNNTKNSLIVPTGGYVLWGEGLPGQISALYAIFYPLGMVVMILCWAWRCGKTGIDRSLDFGMRNSVITVVANLLIGIIVMSLAKEIVMAITGLSYSLTTRIYPQFGSVLDEGGGIASLEKILEGIKFGGLISGIISALDGNIGKGLFFLFIKFTFILNIAYMAVLAGVSPLFLGFAGGGDSTKRVAINFLKEYGKVALVPPMVFAYAAICMQLMNDVTMMFSGLVLGISCIGFAKNKLDRLLS